MKKDEGWLSLFIQYSLPYEQTNIYNMKNCYAFLKYRGKINIKMYSLNRK